MINVGNIAKLGPLLKDFIKTHPDLTQFLIEQSEGLHVGDEIELSFVQSDEKNTLVVTESDIELFSILRSFAK